MLATNIGSKRWSLTSGDGDMGHDILVDGYNVIKNNPMFQLVESKNFSEARNVLIKQLKNRFRFSTQRVVVVFDGSGSYEQWSTDEHIWIIYSRHGEKADQVIARLAAEAKLKGTTVSLYSDDTEVKDSVVEHGGSAHTTQQLTRRLNAAPRDVEIRSQHRQRARRDYGIDPRQKIEDDSVYEPHRPHKKKGKSARRRR
jgi:predicted RNA-binding protein with PIN domain